MKNTIIYDRIDKCTLHDRRKDTSGHDWTLQLLGGTELGILLLAIAHDQLALEINKAVCASDKIKLELSGSLKRRGDDGMTYWLVDQWKVLASDLVKVENKIGKPIVYSEGSLEDELKKLVDSKRRIPLIFKFHEAIEIKGLMRKKADELTTICGTVRGKNGKRKVYVQSKPDATSNYYYYMQTIPDKSCREIVLHPDYKPIEQIEEGSYKSLKALELALKEMLEKGVRSLVTFEFTEKVFFPIYAVEPIDKITIEVVKRDLSYDKRRSWNEYINLFTKPRGKRFYDLDVMPYQVIKKIYEHATEKGVFQIAKSVTAIKPLKLEATKLIPSHSMTGRISLFEILSKRKTKNQQRDQNSCLFCGRGITSDEPNFVNLSVDGYLLSTLDIEMDQHYGFFKIGPECKKDIPEDYVFTYKQISSSPYAVKIFQLLNE